MTNINLNNEIMKKFHIDHASKTIIMPKSIAKNASTYGKDEYHALLALQSSFPNYELKVREIKRTPSRKKRMKGLTFEYMERFIERNGSDDQKEAFEALRNPVHDDGLVSTRQSYGAVRKWFVTEFPQVLDYQKKIKQILVREGA